jgi:hypothetical protein
METELPFPSVRMAFCHLSPNRFDAGFQTFRMSVKRFCSHFLWRIKSRNSCGDFRSTPQSEQGAEPVVEPRNPIFILYHKGAMSYLSGFCALF